MAVAYDATGVGASGLNSTGSAVSGTSFNHTAASGADVFFAIQFTNSGSGSPSSVQYNGSTMTLVSSQRVNNVSTDGATFLYRAAGAGTGSVASVTYTVPATCHYVGNSVSYSGVGGVGTLSTASGSGTVLSSGSITVSTGQIALCAYGTGNTGSAAVVAHSGGTNRSNGAQSTFVSLLISDSTSTATFTASTSPFSNLWSSIAVVLIPPVTVSLTGRGTGE